MSLIGSLLAFVLIPLKAKPPKEAENLAVMALAEEVRLLQLAFDYWRNAGMTLMDENERLREELRQMRLRADDALQYNARNDPTSPYYRHRGYAQAQQAQANAMAQASLQRQSYQGLGQLQQSAGDYQAALQNYAGCTCVPSRSHALGVHPAEPLPR